MESRMRRRDLKERFSEKVMVVESGCHEWQSTIHRDGYGKFWFDGKQEQAHRAGWRIHQGEIPADKWVLHKCDNRKCVRLDHLYLGTPAENVRDKIERHPWWGRMKYGPEISAEVRALRFQGLSQQAIADRVGMHQTTVSDILRSSRLMDKRKD